MRPLDKLRKRAYIKTEGAVLIVFTGMIKVVKGKDKMALTRQDYEEWKMTRSHHPEIKLDYLEYREMLRLIGECAKILEKATPMIEDNDLLLVPLNDPDLTQKFDCKIQLSNQAFEELEESLGLGN